MGGVTGELVGEVGWTREAALAAEISHCPLVLEALGAPDHPCAGVVNEQPAEPLADRQCPEPWVGTLGTAKVLCISSNPSISDGGGDDEEDFPRWSWAVDRRVEFFLNRFDQEHAPVHASFRNDDYGHFLVRYKNGRYGNGRPGSTSPQDTWNKLQARVSEILGYDAHPHTDYALTEVVHCKSRSARGVKPAVVRVCSSRYLDRIGELSPAPVVLVLGRHVRPFAMSRWAVPAQFGLERRGQVLTTDERAARDVVIGELGGRRRLIVYTPQPTASRRLSSLFGPYLDRIRQVALSGEVPVDWNP